MDSVTAAEPGAEDAFCVARAVGALPVRTRESTPGSACSAPLIDGAFVVMVSVYADGSITTWVTIVGASADSVSDPAPGATD